MSLYAVIGSGIREVPRREMNGVFSKAFPLINCVSRFVDRRDAVNDLIKRVEEIVVNADDDVIISSYSQVNTPYGNLDTDLTYSKTVFDEDHPASNLEQLRTCLEDYRYDHVEVTVGGTKSTYAIICIMED